MNHKIIMLNEKARPKKKKNTHYTIPFIKEFQKMQANLQ